MTNPLDTAASSATRFGIELAAWLAGPWAAAELVGAWWAVPVALVVLMGLPATFNTPGDKNVDGIATPGPIRIGIEMLLLVVAIASAWYVWPTWAAILVTLLGLAMVATGVPRYRWLATTT